MTANTRTTLFDESFPSTFEAMSAALARAIDVLLEAGWIAPRDEPCTRLCVEEALVNAIRHGNRCDAARKVRLAISAQDGRCTMRVFDEGQGFAPEAVAEPTTDQLGGRGICLIRHYMDEVNFNEADHCLEMVFRRRDSREERCAHG